MANFIPIQIDKDTGRQVASRRGLGLGVLPTGFFLTMGYAHVEAVVSSLWIIPHGADLLHYQIQIFDDSGNLIIPDQVITVDSNTIHVVHGAPITGKAIITFLKEN